MKIASLIGKKFDLHAHTSFSDGKNTPEEMVKAAIEKGLFALGFSDHSYTFYDESYCMKKEKYEEYIKTASFLKEKYKGKIEIFCGIEQDLYSAEPTTGFDYSIGSVHYLKVGKDYFAIDDGIDVIKNATEKYFGGDIYSLIEEYFLTVSKAAEKGNDIVGHFDYITLYNEDGELFDERDQRYISAWKKAADKLIKDGIYFEINTGGMARKHKRHPYPTEEIQDYITKNGGKFICSSDSHSTQTLCYKFEDYIK